MIGKRTRRRLVGRRLALAGAAVLVTVAFLVLAWIARERLPEIPLSDEMRTLGFDPYMLGYIFQSIVVPAALLYLASNARVFRRALAASPQAGFSWPLFGLLALIQLLVVAYELGRPLLLGPAEPAQVTIGLLVVVTAGLLGGWRLGLGLGLVALVLRGSLQVALFLGEGLWAEAQLLYGAEGLGGVIRHFPFWPILLDHYFFNLWASAAVWAGLVAGLYAELLGERRFQPLPALALGLGVDLGAGSMMAIAAGPPGLLFLLPNVVVSGVAVSVVALIARSVQADAARRRAESAELARAQAELRALRAQINPHFLFNALNTIRYFVRTDPEAARRLLLSLSEVFQRALRSGEFVPLQDELSYVEAYLALEQARLDQRLRVEWSPPVAELRESPLGEQPVPTLILQPIVENAVVHGIAQQPEGGTVRVQVGRADGDLLLRVADDGPGMAAERLAEVLDPAWPGRSIGLRNVDGRLRALYGAAHGLVIESAVGQGTTVLIRIAQ